jgi:hypothetical protein
MTEENIQEINIPFPDEETLRLQMAIGATRLRIEPSDGEAWIEGSYHDPSQRVKLRITQDGGTVRITQGDDPFDFIGLIDGVPELNLKLGKAKPFRISIQGGASENVFDFGGIPLTRMEVKHGAGSNRIDFSAPNPEQMTLLEVGAGAGEMRLRNLANSNAAEVRVEGGAAAFTCNFNGEIKSEMNVRISTGVSSVRIEVPTATAATIRTESVLGGLDVGDGYMKKEGAFWTEAAVTGQTPVIDIHASSAMGSLAIKTS